MAGADESLLEFPCDIAIKVLGRNDDEFREAVYAIMRSHFEDFSDDDVAERSSRADSYLSLTIVVHAESRGQMDAVYRDLTAHEQVMIVL